MHYAREVMRLCSLFLLWSSLAIASGADVDGALARYTSARNRETTMLGAAVVGLIATAAGVVYFRRKK
jgi:hypothetical protein